MQNWAQLAQDAQTKHFTHLSCTKNLSAMQTSHPTRLGNVQRLPLFPALHKLMCRGCCSYLCYANSCADPTQRYKNDLTRQHRQRCCTNAWEVQRKKILAVNQIFTLQAASRVCKKPKLVSGALSMSPINIFKLILVFWVVFE